MVQDAVLRNLEVIGEAAKGIEDEHRERWPDAQWRRMAALRRPAAGESGVGGIGRSLPVTDQVQPNDIPEVSGIPGRQRRIGLDGPCGDPQVRF